MRRRAAFLAVMVIGAAAMVPLVSLLAQRPAKMFRIGVLSLADRPSTKGFDAFRDELQMLGYVDGQNITIEYRLAAGDISRLSVMAGELVRASADVIVFDGGTSVAQIARAATRTIPLVGPIGPDPVSTGLVESFAHPGGNITGFSGIGVELARKRLQLLKEALPAISHLAVLWNPASNVLDHRATMEAAGALGVELHVVQVVKPDDIDAGFEVVAAGGAQALDVLPSAMFWNHREQIISLAAKYRIPAIYPEQEYAGAGGLLAYGQDIPDLFRRVAVYVDKILKGAKPSDLPIQQPTKLELLVNLKTAKALGLTIPPSILARADEVIE